MSGYKSSFFVVPTRILDLPDLTMAFLKVYETVFQFWNHDKTCFLSNPMIMERTGIKAESTIREAFIFFEKHNELKRKKIKGKRYLVQPDKRISVQDSPVAPSTPTRRSVDGRPVAKSTHKNKNINKEVKREKRRKKRVPLPENFIPDEKRLILLQETSLKSGLTSEQLLTKFRNIKNSKEVFSADWHGELENFLINEKPAVFKNIIKTTKKDSDLFKNENKSTVKFWEKGNPDYDRLHEGKG